MEHYVLGIIIGKGSYGEVTLAKHKKDKKQYVIKKIDLHNASEKERSFAQQEVEILSKLRHPNIVSYKESFQTDDACLGIVMGYCEGGDLYTKLKKQAKQGEYLHEKQIVEWFVQIAMALQYMHDRHILHRDLKTQNIFLTKSKIIKLGDLGIARVLDSNIDMATTMIGTPYYMSPELFSNKPYNHKSDVWALGCCVYEMATLKHAFNAKDMNSLVYKILKGKTPPVPKHYSSELQEIIKSMLNYDPMQRPSASRILRHPFIKKHIAIFLEGTKNRRKSREERQKRHVTTKQSNDSGYSESSIGSNNVNPEVIATASKIDINILDMNENCKESSDKPLDLLLPRENLHDVKPKTPSQRQNSNSPFSSDSKNSPDVVSDLSSDSSSSAKRTNSNPSKSSHARKVLTDRIQAKARLKRQQEEMELKINNGKDVKKETDIKSNGKELKSKNVESNIDKQDCRSPPERVRRKRSDGISPRKKSQEHSRRPLPELPDSAALKHYSEEPRLPLPRFKSDLEKDRVKNDKKEVKTDPQCSAGMPNIAARRKRRQRQQERESQMSPPSLQKRSSDLSVVDYPSYTPRSHEEIIKEQIQRRSLVHDDKDSVDGPVNNLSEPGASEICFNEEVEISREEKNNEVSNLIVSLQATLKMEPVQKDKTSLEESNDMEIDDSNSKDFSPSASGRLKDRIKRLRSECVSGIGEKNLLNSYLIIDTYPEEIVETKLVELIGREKFELYSGQIWQLKFCEEFKL